ncbi:MAG: hypothetical protein R3F50_02365 [Gammaproteobacteria bacterium]
MAASKRFIISIIILLSPSINNAAEIEGDIPIELVKSLIELPQLGNIRFYDEIPTDFPPVTIPTEFSIVGGVDMDIPGYSRVVVKSELGLSDGMFVLTESLEADGYIKHPAMSYPERGFTPAVYLPTPVNLCND